MNRLILKYATPITVVILAIFAWVVYRRIVDGGRAAIVTLSIAAVVVWAAGTFLFVFFWPRITVGGFKRVFTTRGMGGGPIPVNTLYAVPESASQSASAGTVIATGADDLLYLGGWLDVAAGPQVLHVPDSGGRYLSIQFTDPASGSNFAYVGTRKTGTGPGDFLLCAAGWSGATPPGLTRIDLPHRTALLVGRVFVADDADRGAAYALAEQVQLAPYRPN
ncbi:DUF1254 domain-containing protein [Leifsonia sp. EB34]|uniref:DUF1254 domain-containing protein n=1 Tax=Leifsonia sp. EB34 TaxID=3156303 RepID=UPI0035137F62